MTREEILDRLTLVKMHNIRDLEFGCPTEQAIPWYVGKVISSILTREEPKGPVTLDHNDPSKPSHRLTNGPEPSKPLKAMVATSKNHRKTIDGNGQTAQKHSMVMISSKTIEKPLIAMVRPPKKIQW